MKNNPFEFLAEQINGHLPESLRPIKQEVQSFAKKIVGDRLQDLNLVSRADYEQQLRLLEASEKRIQDLESQIANLKK